MKKNLCAVIALFVINTLQAQQKEGTVIYERTMQMQLSIDDNAHMGQMMPKSRTDKFELNFGNNQSLWKHVDEENGADEMNNGGMQIRMIGPGQDDIIFCNFDAANKTEQRSMFDKKFIVADSIRKLNWKITGETKTILDHVCQQAIAQRYGKRTVMNMENGKIERKETNDTSNIVAWFTTDIPVAAGPEVQGQLPGLILALDMNDGRMVYKALEISPKVNLATIKAPVKGKKVTPAEFTTETQQMMEEMQKNQGGGNRIIRIQN
ncbi:MAG: GLPGLI family protein [Ferruginibacter sp.]